MQKTILLVFLSFVLGVVISSGVFIGISRSRFVSIEDYRRLEQESSDSIDRLRKSQTYRLGQIGELEQIIRGYEESDKRRSIAIDTARKDIERSTDAVSKLRKILQTIKTFK